MQVEKWSRMGAAWMRYRLVLIKVWGRKVSRGVWEFEDLGLGFGGFRMFTVS